jgi:hypothetical protein
VDARRQWFNYYGLNEETYRYGLEVMRLAEDHELAEKAISCQTPRVGGAQTVDDLSKQAFEDQTQMLKTGEATIVETM